MPTGSADEAAAAEVAEADPEAAEAAATEAAVAAAMAAGAEAAARPAVATPFGVVRPAAPQADATTPPSDAARRRQRRAGQPAGAGASRGFRSVARRARVGGGGHRPAGEPERGAAAVEFGAVGVTVSAEPQRGGAARARDQRVRGTAGYAASRRRNSSRSLCGSRQRSRTLRPAAESSHGGAARCSAGPRACARAGGARADGGVRYERR